MIMEDFNTFMIFIGHWDLFHLQKLYFEVCKCTGRLIEVIFLSPF